MDFLFGKALYALLAFDIRGLGNDFARLHEFVRSFKAGSQLPEQEVVDRVCRAVNHACVWYPRPVLCLQRSTVTTCLLRSCGVPAQMVVGAQILPFKAHAWTEVEGKAINERKDVQKIYGVWERC